MCPAFGSLPTGPTSVQNQPHQLRRGECIGFVEPAPGRTRARFNVQRLRVTWIVHHLSVGTHLIEFQRMAGVLSWPARETPEVRHPSLAPSPPPTKKPDSPGFADHLLHTNFDRCEDGVTGCGKRGPASCCRRTHSVSFGLEGRPRSQTIASGGRCSSSTGPASPNRSPSGRPRTAGDLEGVQRPSRCALLVAMVLCATTNEPLLITSFRDVLFRRIGPAMRTELGIPLPPGALDARGWEAVYRNLRTRFHGLVDLMDPSPSPKNRRMANDQFLLALQLRRSQLADEDWSEREQRLEWFVNQILEASLQMLPREVRRRWKGSVAVDATVVPAFARPEPRGSTGAQGEAPRGHHSFG